MKANDPTLRRRVRQWRAEVRDHDANAEECRRLMDVLRRRGAEHRPEMEALLGIARYHRVQSLKKSALASGAQDQLGA